MKIAKSSVFVLVLSLSSTQLWRYFKFLFLCFVCEVSLSFLQMSKVPWYKQRLKALLFKARFADKVEEIKPVRR